MKTLQLVGLTSFLILAVIIRSSNATTITGAISATTTNMGELYGSTPLNNIVNQSGLSASYISGVTDFDSFVASTTHSYWGEYEWFGFKDTYGSIIFDLGNLFYIDRLALWNEDSQGIKEIFVSTSTTNDNWLPFGVGDKFTATDWTMNTDYSADIFKLSSTSVARFVKIDVLSTYAHSDPNIGHYPTLGEVAFSTAPVPEPATCFFLALVLLAYWA